MKWYSYSYRLIQDLLLDERRTPFVDFVREPVFQKIYKGSWRKASTFSLVEYRYIGVKASGGLYRRKPREKRIFEWSYFWQILNWIIQLVFINSAPVHSRDFLRDVWVLILNFQYYFLSERHFIVRIHCRRSLSSCR